MATPTFSTALRAKFNRTEIQSPEFRCPACNCRNDHAEDKRNGTRFECVALACKARLQRAPEGIILAVGAAKKKGPPPGESESEIQEAIAAYLVSEGWLTVRINSGSFKDYRGIPVATYYIYDVKTAPVEFTPGSGLSDLIAFRGSAYLILEVKTPTGRLEKNQVAFIAFAGRHAVPVHLVRSVADVEAILYSD